MHTDAKAMLAGTGAELSSRVVVNNLLHADDTLLIDVDGDNVFKYMKCVKVAGGMYWPSFQLE